MIIIFNLFSPRAQTTTTACLQPYHPSPDGSTLLEVSTLPPEEGPAWLAAVAALQPTLSPEEGLAVVPAAFPLQPTLPPGKEPAGMAAVQQPTLPLDEGSVVVAL